MQLLSFLWWCLYFDSQFNFGHIKQANSLGTFLPQLDEARNSLGKGWVDSTTLCNTKTMEWKVDISFQSRRQRLPDGSYIADINISGVSAGFKVPFSEPSESSSCLKQAVTSLVLLWLLIITAVLLQSLKGRTLQLLQTALVLGLWNDWCLNIVQRITSNYSGGNQHLKGKSKQVQRWCGKRKGPEKEQSKATWCEWNCQSCHAVRDSFKTTFEPKMDKKDKVLKIL